VVALYDRRPVSESGLLNADSTRGYLNSQAQRFWALRSTVQFGWSKKKTKFNPSGKNVPFAVPARGV
jgi:hypothetical protein